MTILQLQIKTLDGEITVEVKKTIKGRNLFNIACRTIGVIETCYFGILIENNTRFSWLRNNKRLHKQIKNTQLMKPLIFMVKFYPVCFNEVSTKSTKYLFYLQMRHAIISESVFCPADVSVLLASYALKVQYNSFNIEPELLNVNDFIPNSVLSLYSTDLNMWKNLVIVWFKKHDILSRDEAISEYLEICQDLAMFGINYFAVKSVKGIDLWLGVSASGLKLYDRHDFLKPNISYEWQEICKICVNSKTLSVKFIKVKKDLKLHVEKKLIDELFHLLTGNHELYLKRREFKVENTNEPLSLNVDESQSDRVKEIINCYQSKFHEMNHSYKQMEEMNMLMVEKCNLAEEEAIMLSSIISTQCLKYYHQIVHDFLIKT